MELEKPPERPVLPNPQPIAIEDISWKVVTSKYQPEGPDWVIIGVSAEDYKLLSNNMAEIRRWVTEAMHRLQYYRGELDDGSAGP